MGLNPIHLIFLKIGECHLRMGDYNNILKALGITLLAFLLAELLTAPFSVSTSAMFSSPEKTDSTLSDFYAQVADKRPVRKISNRIVAVDIDRADRNGIAEIIETVALCQPTAIAVDINFEEPHDDDSRLLRALNPGCPVILPLGLTSANDKHDEFVITEKPFFYDSLPNVVYGAANLPGKFENATIREFPISFKLRDGGELPSFVASIAEAVDSAAYNRLMSRCNNVEIIDFASMEIPSVTLEEIYENPDNITGKVVMIGAVNEASDMHSTPVRRSLAGMIIHAYSLATVLHGNYYEGVPKFVDYIVASILCFWIVLFNISMKAKVRGLILRILQVILVYLVVRIGYELYVGHRIVANFSLTLLMVAFGLFAIDVWNGSIGLGELFTKWTKAICKKLRRHEE